jgi:hypothetical protein
MGALPTVSALAHGDHVCAFFDDDVQRRSVVSQFVRDGLAGHDRVWYFSDTAPADTVLAELEQDGVAVEGAVQSGQLAVFAAEDSYLVEQPFDPDRMAATLRTAIDDALADGYAGFRVSGDLTWATRDIPGADRLLAYEARLDGLFAGRPAAAICQYDRRRFDTTTLAATVGLHTHWYGNRTPLPPPLVLVPTEDGTGLRIEGDADFSSRDALDAALAAIRSDEAHLFLAGLRFVDVCCLNGMLVLARPPRRLVLHDPPRTLVRMLDALNFGDQIEVRRS